ncbi:MAG TPA: hypothetical protein DDW52_27330 [Planctomycetaceae bacterium]|nr:hypothetical protein [Planctomycetaceae bacterium]
MGHTGPPGEPVEQAEAKRVFGGSCYTKRIAVGDETCSGVCGYTLSKLIPKVTGQTPAAAVPCGAVLNCTGQVNLNSDDCAGS